MERISRITPNKTDTPVRTNTCDNCKHFARVNGAEECHRNPPQGAPLMGQAGYAGAIGYWPPVYKDAAGRFCGEWQPIVEVSKPLSDEVLKGVSCRVSKGTRGFTWHAE